MPEAARRAPVMQSFQCEAECMFTRWSASFIGRRCRYLTNLVARLGCAGALRTAPRVISGIKRDARNCSRHRSAFTLPRGSPLACGLLFSELHLTQAAGLGASEDLRGRAGSSGRNRHAASEAIRGVLEAARRALMMQCFFCEAESIFTRWSASIIGRRCRCLA